MWKLLLFIPTVTAVLGLYTPAQTQDTSVEQCFVIQTICIAIMDHQASRNVAQAQCEGQNQSENPSPAMPSASQPTGQTAPTIAQAIMPSKPVHSLVIDANAIIKNDPTVSTLLAQSERLYTIPAVVSESVHTKSLALEELC